MSLAPRTIFPEFHAVRIIAFILDTDIVTAAAFAASPPKTAILCSSSPGHLFLLLAGSFALRPPPPQNLTHGEETGQERFEPEGA